MVPYKLMLLLLCGAAVADKMNVEYSWSLVDYKFSSSQARDIAIKSQKFIPENCVILDVDVYQGVSESNYYTNSGGSSPSPANRVFLTVPRLKKGVAASLAELVPGNQHDSVLLKPYPNWKVHTFSEDQQVCCDDIIVSVFRTKIDEFGRLWFADTGKVNQFESDVRTVCPPKLLIYDLKNNKKIRSYTFPASRIKQNTLLTNIVVDTRDSSGRNSFAYIADTTEYKLLVYDLINDDSWTIDQAYFYPYPIESHFRIDSVDFDLMDGVLALALSPVMKNDRTLYFHSFASKRESWVSANFLQNKSKFENGLIGPSGVFIVSGEVRDEQSVVEVMTNNGILFSSMVDNSLTCWNSQDYMTSKNIYTVYKNDVNFQFPSGMKIIGDQLWAVSNQLQNLFKSEPLNPDTIKYRVLVGQINDLISGTGCSKRPKFDYDDDEYLMEPFDGNSNDALRDWRPEPGTPWSYSRTSRVFERKGGPRTAGKSIHVWTAGAVNLHGAPSDRRSTAVSYDCRTTVVNGRPLTGRDCRRAKARHRNRLKRAFGSAPG